MSSDGNFRCSSPFLLSVRISGDPEGRAGKKERSQQSIPAPAAVHEVAGLPLEDL